MKEDNIIHKKIQEFIKKYYLKKLIQGFLIFGIVLIIFSFSLIILEKYLYLNSERKKILLIVYLLFVLISLFYYTLLPILQLIGLIKGINKTKINKIITNHFHDIKDYLWNYFELTEEKKVLDNYSKELVYASINQKIEKLKFHNFKEAVNIRDNIKVLIGFVGIIVLTVFIFIIDQEQLNQSSFRLIHISKEYEKPSLYEIDFINTDLEVGKGDDLTITVKITSKKNIEKSFIEYGDNQFIMTNDSMNYYSYRFSSINNSLEFNFSINDYRSKNFRIKVKEKPILSSFEIEIKKPDYIDQKNQKINNLSEFSIPSGSRCKFELMTYKTDQLEIRTEDSIKLSVEKIKDDLFSFSYIFSKKTKLFITLKNSDFYFKDILIITIDVIEDEYPSITVLPVVDSLNLTTVYFKGIITDDYGFSSLKLLIERDEKVDSTFEIDIIKSSLQNQFFFVYDFSSYQKSESNVLYYFEVKDNDVLNNYKSSISEKFIFKFPNINDLIEKQEEEYLDLENLLKSSKELSQEIKSDIFKLQQKLINSDLKEWERIEAIKDILKKKENLENSINRIQNENKNLNNYLNSFNDQEKSIIEKQQQIQDLLDNLLSEEMKKLFEQLNEMMKNLNSDDLNKVKSKMDVSLEDLEKQLDKNLRMLQDFQITQKLELLKKNIDELKKELENKDLSSTMIENIKEKANSIKDEYEKMQIENKDNDKLMNLEKEFSDINDEFEKALKSLDKKNKKDSENALRKNKENLENLSYIFDQMIGNNEEENAGEDIENLKQILDNLIILSFNQEKIINLPINDFFTKKNMDEQKQLNDYFTVISDSIYSLAVRIPAINTSVNKEIVTIKSSFILIDNELQEGSSNYIKSNQQIILTSINNLSLFFAEVVENMQKQMANQKPGQSNCNKPGNNPNPNSTSSLKKMQEKLQKQMESLQKMLKEGNGNKKMDSEFGKTLGQQEMMQNLLQKLMNSQEVGSGAYETLKEVDKLLEKTKQDVLKKNISNETINRQKEILTRLLEAENAEMERKQDEKRKSNTAKNQYFSNPQKYFDNTNSINNFEETIIKNKLKLKAFYQGKYQNYMFQLDSLNGK